MRDNRVFRRLYLSLTEDVSRRLDDAYAKRPAGFMRTRSDYAIWLLAKGLEGVENDQE